MIEWIEDPPDTAELERLSGQHAALKRWLLRALVACLLPLPVLGVGLYFIAQKQYQVGAVLAVIGGAGFLGGMAWVGWLAPRVAWLTSRLARAEEAVRLGFRMQGPVAARQMPALRRFTLLGENASVSAPERHTGRFAGMPAEVSELELGFDMGEQEDVVRQSVIVLLGAAEGVPDLSVSTIKTHSRLGLSGPLAVKGPAPFNKAFALASSSAGAASFISPALADLCVRERKIAFEVQAGDLMVFWPRKPIPAGKLEERLGIAAEIARLLRESTG